MKRIPGNAKRQQGFSLLEAIVAMVLVATTGMALFAWINTNLISLGRAHAVTERAEAITNALAYMEHVNPAEQPEGRVTLGQLELEWQSKIIEPLKDGANHPMGLSDYQVGLYDMQVELQQEQKQLATFVLRQVGYRQVRDSIKSAMGL
jgi:general secretion pathway protein I